MAIFTGFSKVLGGTEKETPGQQFFYGLVQKNVLVTGSDGQLGSEIKALTDRMNLPFRFFLPMLIVWILPTSVKLMLL